MMKHRFLFAICTMSAAVLPLRAADAPPAGQIKAWGDANPVRSKVGALRKTDASAAAALLEDTLNKVQDPNVAADLFTLLGDVYTTELKEPAKTLALFDRALPLFQKPEYKVPPYHYLTMIGAKANALATLKKGTEAEALLKENWPLVNQSVQSDNAYGQIAVRDALRAYVAAFEAQNKGAQATDFLSNFLIATPQYLNLSGRDAASWIFNELQTRLQKQGKWDESLSWAKLNYQLCAFDKPEIERATQTLSKIWAAQDDFAAAGRFSRAQTDTTINNPLIAAKAPTLTEENRAALKKWLADMEGRQALGFKKERTRDIVKGYIVLGTPDDLREAMKTAVKLLKERPDLQESSLLVCRVFKAADCNLLRANAFLAYMNGEGTNPVTEFLKK